MNVSNGRCVYYCPGSDENLNNGDQPCSATVAHINEDGTLNLSVLAGDGNHHPWLNVPFIPEVDAGSTPTPPFCCWPPRVPYGRPSGHGQLAEASPESLKQVHRETVPAVDPMPPADDKAKTAGDDKSTVTDPPKTNDGESGASN